MSKLFFEYPPFGKLIRHYSRLSRSRKKNGLQNIVNKFPVLSDKKSMLLCLSENILNLKNAIMRILVDEFLTLSENHLESFKKKESKLSFFFKLNSGNLILKKSDIMI